MQWYVCEIFQLQTNKTLTASTENDSPKQQPLPYFPLELWLFSNADLELGCFCTFPPRRPRNLLFLSFDLLGRCNLFI